MVSKSNPDALLRYQDAVRRRIGDRVERVRAARAKQGHQLTLMQEAIISCIASTDPRHDPNDAKKLEAISEAIQRGEVWLEQEEWRISTWFDTKIAKIVRDGKDWYQVAVTCDRQMFSSECHSLEKAFAFMHLYKQLIIDQFYSVGPAWAYNSLLEL